MTMNADAVQPSTVPKTGCDELYRQASEQFAPAIVRVANGYERDADKRRDLIQDIHVALWRSMASYEGRCTLGTWVYRVAHNIAAGHVGKARRRGALVSLDTISTQAAVDSHERSAASSHGLARLQDLIHSLAAADRQIILLYLDGLSAKHIAEVAGLSQSNISVKIHRIKAVLANRIAAGEPS